MKKLFRILVYFYIFIIFIFAIFLIFTWINNFKPDEKSVVFYSENPDLLSDTSNISILTWNIGYFGEDESDNHQTLTESDEKTKKVKLRNNLEGIKNILMTRQNTDFIFLQEIDIESNRTEKLNEYNYISDLFPDRKCTSAINYNVGFIPAPVFNPIGKVKAGMMTISKYIPSSAVRYAYPGDDEFPKNLFNYDRCFLVNRYKLSNEKELIIVNIHNSGLENTSQNKPEIDFLYEFLKSEYEKGNYVIVGGDWNQTPSNFKPSFQTDKYDLKHTMNLDLKEMKDWKCIFDGSIPTKRYLNKPYIKGQTLTTVNDFYLISPNIDPVRCKTVNTVFKFSSHQPVELIVKLKL